MTVPAAIATYRQRSAELAAFQRTTASCCPHNVGSRRDDVDYLTSCFGDAAEADAFVAAFGGERSEVKRKPRNAYDFGV